MKFSAMSYQSGQWTSKGMQQVIQFVKIEPWKNRKNTANKLVVKNTSSSEKVGVLKCLLLLWAYSMRWKYEIINHRKILLLSTCLYLLFIPGLSENWNHSTADLCVKRSIFQVIYLRINHTLCILAFLGLIYFPNI